MNKEKPIYVAVDSCVLINLAYIYDKKAGNKNFYEDSDFNNSNFSHIRNYYNCYEKILDAIFDDKLRIVVVPTVFHESNHSTSVLNFVKSFCYTPNVNILKNLERQSKIAALARKYCFPYFDKNEIKQCAPMKKVYIAECQKAVPSNDAYIMAESTFENCCLITVNKQDFIYKKESGIDNERRKGIVEINRQAKYIDSENNVPKPISLGEAVLAIEKEDFTLFQPDEVKFIKCDRVL